MATDGARTPLKPGEPAPDFMLPSVHPKGTVSLADYRGKSPVLLALLRGLYCPFCRRQVASLGGTSEKLQAAGVETLAIVATQAERASLYLQFHPTRVAVAADPDLVTHRAFGVRKAPVTPLFLLKALTTRVNPTGELPKPVSPFKIGPALNQLDRFELTETDQHDLRRQEPLPIGQFLVDQGGIVRWVNIEGADEGVAGMGKFPSDEELLAAARALPS